MLRGILFDLDGVLADSETFHLLAWRKALTDLGITVPESWYSHWLGVPDQEMVADLEKRRLIGRMGDRLLECKRRTYTALLENTLVSYPGVREALEKLNGRPLAVATGSGRAEALETLRALGFASFFQTVVTADDVDRVKPAPDLFLLAARRLGLEPSSCAAIEDSPTGLASARAAGCLTLGVATNHRAEKLKEAHHLFPGPREAILWAAARLEP